MDSNNNPTYETESNLYWSLVSECYRVSHLTPAAGQEIGRLCWEASGIIHFSPAHNTGEPGRLTCAGFPRRSRVVDADLNNQIMEGLTTAAKLSCPDDWQTYVADYIGVSNTKGGAA